MDKPTGELKILIEAGATPIILTPNRAWLQEKLGVAPVITMEVGQQVKDSNGAIMIQEYHIRVLVVNQQSTARQMPALATPETMPAIPAPCAPTLPPPSAPRVCAHIQPSGGSSLFPTENRDAAEGANDLPVRAAWQWGPSWAVKFGRHVGLTLGDILARYGSDALYEYLWRGEAQIKRNREAGNAQYYHINKTMVAYIQYLLHIGKMKMPLKDPKGGNWDEWPENLRVRQFPRPRPASPIEALP